MNMTHKIKVRTMITRDVAPNPDVYELAQDAVQSVLKSVPNSARPKVSIHWRNIDKFLSSEKIATITVATVEWINGSTPSCFNNVAILFERRVLHNDEESASVSAATGNDSQ